MPLVKVAVEVGEEVIAPDRHKFSPQRCTQPQLSAVLCLMRYEDWTLRASERRLNAHSELSQPLRVKQTPDHTTGYRFFERVEEAVIGKGPRRALAAHGRLKAQT